MMKRAIAISLAIMLCMTLVACSNQPIPQTNMESGESFVSETVDVTSSDQTISDDNNTAHSQNPTEHSTPSTMVNEEMTTSEKESKTTDTSSPITETTTPPKVTEGTVSPKQSEPFQTVEETKSDETTPIEETTQIEPNLQKEESAEETKPEDTAPAEPPSTYEIESLVAQYINQFRVAQGETAATVLQGLSEVARYRARQLVSDFSHNSIPNPCTVLQYGEYIDMTLFGGDSSESYYRGYNREAIGKGDWFGTADQMAQRIANGFKKSSQHWAYVGDSEYSYMAVGVYYNEADSKWYCCICMSSKNYGD